MLVGYADAWRAAMPSEPRAQDSRDERRRRGAAADGGQRSVLPAVVLRCAAPRGADARGLRRAGATPTILLRLCCHTKLLLGLWLGLWLGLCFRLGLRLRRRVQLERCEDFSWAREPRLSE